MRLVFWHNCLSPHQLSYIAKLMEDDRVDKVVFVAGVDTLDRRREMGWGGMSYPGLERCDVLIAPTDETIDKLQGERIGDSVHLFGGIRGDRFVYSAFKRSLKFKGLRRVDVSECPRTFAFGRANGKPLWLHWLKWKIMDSDNMRNIESVFAMGEKAVLFFRSLNKRWTVFPFGYCTYPQPCAEELAMTCEPRISFVGSLSRRKSVGILLISTKLALLGGG